MTKPIVDLAGHRVGSLMVLAPDGKRHGGRMAWACLCDCGTFKTIASTSLVQGVSTTCGCGTARANSLRSLKDITGQRFGRLVVQFRSGTKRRRAIWSCLCDCGATAHVMGGKLIAGHTSSCGCARYDQPRLRSEKSRLHGVAQAGRRRARVRNASGSFTSEQITELYAKQKGRCANCGERLGDEYHRDHRIPLARGGTNDILNIELLCGPCNLAKHAKDPVDWAQENGRLL